MRRLLAFTLVLILAGAAGCAPQPAAATTPAPSSAASAAAPADATASPQATASMTKEQAVDRYLKTVDGKTTVQMDAIKADFTQFQVVSRDTSFDLKAVTVDKVKALMDKIAAVQMTELPLDTQESPLSNWNLQCFTSAGKLKGDSVTIQCTKDEQIDVYILIGDMTIRKVYSISTADNDALRAAAQEQSKIANGGQ